MKSLLLLLGLLAGAASAADITILSSTGLTSTLGDPGQGHGTGPLR